MFFVKKFNFCSYFISYWMVRLLLKTSDPLLENYNKMTPLECAMSEGSARIVNGMFSFTVYVK